MKKSAQILTVITVILIYQFSVLSCTKTVTKTVTVTDTVTKTVTDTVTKYVADNSIANLLFGKQWVVDSLYWNYSATSSGNLVFVRGGTNNSQDVGIYTIIFWPDGTQYFTDTVTSSFHNYPYSFRSADSTNFVVTNTSVDYARIVSLTATHLVIYDSTNSGLSYYVYKP